MIGMDRETKNPLVNAKIVGAGISNEVYRRQDAKRGDLEFVMSRGELCEFARCPHRWINGYKEDDTESTEWGTLIDCLAMTPKSFNDCFAVTPATYPGSKPGEEKPWNWNANHCKAWRDALDGKTPVKHETKTMADNAVKFLFGDEVVRDLINSSQKQVMVMAEYRDEETDLVIPIKGLIDLVPNQDHPKHRNSLADFKTCASADPGAWPRNVFTYGYHVQAALYLDAYVAATGEDRLSFLHILQESEPPWEVGRRMLSAEFIELGRVSYIQALKRYAKCLAENRWPGYDDEGGLIIDGFQITEPQPWMVTV